MSSQLKTFARINDVEKLKEYFFHDSVNDEACLSQCSISYSPASDIIAAAFSNTMVVLSSKWVTQATSDVKMVFHVTWQGILENCNGNESVTSILCIPVAATHNRVTARYSPEWTCIAVGFSSGFVRFYTESGCLLLSQMFHNEPVINIKCHSSHLSHYGSTENPEEMYITYGSVICSIIGLALFSTLRACRNQLARAQANSIKMMLPPPLTYRKWGFADQEKVEDSVICTTLQNGSFQHLVTASLCGGFNAEYRLHPPHSTLVVAAGTNPFVGFHYAIETSPLPVLADVAGLVANKVKSALGHAVRGFLFGGREPQVSVEKEPVSPQIEPAELMGCRFGLHDPDRAGLALTVSPLTNFCAVTDSLGRILIVDVANGVVIRMLKGYRDAQCGWLLVDDSGDETSYTGNRRRTLFFILYVAKKGVLEVWPIHAGPRIAMFNVSKNARLLYTNCGTMGFSGGTKVLDNFYNVCILLEPSGELREISVPFHCILSSRDGDKARDTHLLAHVTKLLQEEGVSEGKLVADVTSLAVDLRTSEMKKCALTTLSTNKYITPDVFIAFLEALRANIGSSDDKELLTQVDVLERLAKLYHFANEMYKLPPDYSVVAENSDDTLITVCSTLYVTEDEIDKLMSMIPTVSVKQKRVTFSEYTKKFTLCSFIACFETSDPSQIRLIPELQGSKLSQLGDLVCSNIMYGKCELEDWRRLCEESNITATDMLKLVFSYWLEKQHGITILREMMNLYDIISCIWEIRGAEKIRWRHIRFQLANSSSPLSAITAAVVCRAVSSFRHNMETIKRLEKVCDTKKEEAEQGEAHATTDWETVSQDECDWNILITQLEDISFLDTALKYQPKEFPQGLFRVPYTTPDVTLSLILRSGKGAISELVAKWITSLGLNPDLLLRFEASGTELKEMPKKPLLGVQEGVPLPIDASHEVKEITRAEKEVLELLEKLRTPFPYSVSLDSLLSNMAWEYMLTWKKCTEEMKALEAVMVTLKIIPSFLLRIGCCSLIWTAHLSEVCQATAKLINKVGKTPKDRLCRQHIGVGEDNIIRLIELWVEFIDYYTELASSATTYPEVTSQLQYESLWENSDTSSSPNTVPPLCELALKQKLPNMYLLRLQSHCANVLLILTVLSLRVQRPLDALLDAGSEMLLFTNIQTQKDFVKNHPSEKLIECRTIFLKKAISAVIDDILKPNVEPSVPCYTEQMKPVVDWFSRIFRLCSQWSVPVDALRRHQVRKLYIHGYDQMASEIVPSVNDKSKLGSELLSILGHRVKKLLSSSSQYFAEFSPTVTSWVNSLGEEGRCKISNVCLKEVLELALITNHLIAESSEHKHIISQLVESLEVLYERTRR